VLEILPATSLVLGDPDGIKRRKEFKRCENGSSIRSSR
jgi:hypothetical protein